MKCLFLVAGYATRLFPLTENTPKALLKIGEKRVLDYLLEKVNKIKEIDEIFVISNDKFFTHFQEWAAEKDQSEQRITVLNDHTTSDSGKLGAVGDIQYVLEQTGIEDDLMVLAGDNLFTFELVDFANEFKDNFFDYITVHELNNIKELTRMGVAELNAADEVIGLEEKPAKPKSNIAVDPFYIYKKETLPLFKQYLDEGNNPDAPGNFPAWLYKRKTVKAYWVKGTCIDIGTVENYCYINENFDEIFGGEK